MNKQYIFMFAPVLILFLIFASSCKQVPEATEVSTRTNAGTVRVWDMNEPRGLHPYNSTDMTGFNVKQVVFQKLLDFDYETYELIPVLAVSRPQMEVIKDSIISLTFEIRPEATWDNGTPITARDIEFSYKAAMAPGVDNEAIRPYISFVDSFIFYPDNVRKVTILTDQVYMRAETSIGYDMTIIPEYVYDPDGLLKNFNYSHIKKDTSLKTDPKIVQFAEHFNSEKFLREPEYIIGSGPYSVEEWVTGQRVVLKRKSNWWGDNVVDNRNVYFEANPERIVHEVINDQVAAITALKGGKLDVMRTIKPKEFKEDLLQNDDFKEKFNLHTPPYFGYSFLGLNTKNPKLRDKRTRQALAYLVNYDRMIADVTYGYGTKIVGPVNPAQKTYNDTLKPYNFDIEKGKQLLKEAGWEDTDGDGILDKVINGKKTDLSLQLIYNTGNKDRERVALIFQEDAKKAGVDIQLQTFDWGIMLEKLKSHDFEMFYNAWLGEPAQEDYTQLWATSSANGGSNFTYFGNAKTDELIERINTTLDDEDRVKLVKLFQAVLHEEVPYIFLWSPQNRLAISNRFENTHPSGYRPGYYIPAFTLKNNSDSIQTATKQ